MLKKVYTIEELIKAESDMQAIIANQFLRFVADDDNRDFLVKEYKTSNPGKIRQLVMTAAQNVEWGIPLDSVQNDAVQSVFDGIRFNLEEILAYIDDPQGFEADHEMELSPHVPDFRYMNENSVREYAEREYIKHIMKKYREIAGYDFKTAVEDMAELMKTA